MKCVRKLGLAVAAAMVLVAVIGTASANAEKFAAEVGSGEYASVKAEYTENLLFAYSGLAIDCGSPPLWSPTEIKGKTKVSPISATQEVVKQTCAAPGGAARFEQKGCNFTFSPGNGGGNGTLGVGPAGCGPMILYAAGCEMKIGPQSTPVSPFTVEGSPKTVSVTANTSLKFTGGGLCSGEKSVVIKTKWRLKAYNAAEAQAGLYLTDKTGVFFNSGAKLFEAEEYPKNMGGSNSGKHLFTIAKLPSIGCDDAGFFSLAPLASASSTHSVEAGYGGCWITILFVKRFTTIDMNSCYYTLSAVGTTAVACAVEGDRMEINIWNTMKEEEVTLLCGYKIAPQSGLGAVTYETVGVGFDRGIAVGFNLTGVKSTREGGIGGEGTCGPTEGTVKYSGNATLYG